MNSLIGLGQGALVIWPIWAALFGILLISFFNRQKLGLYGQVFDSPVGVFGLSIVLFWVLCAVLAGFLDLYPPLQSVSGMKDALPMTVPAVDGANPFFLGGDKIQRDIFSRLIWGAQLVLPIAVGATAISFAVGITLGLLAGYVGGWVDTVVSFIANAILAFPVIVLFYLIVLMGAESPLPKYLAAVIFLFPILLVIAGLYGLHAKNRAKLIPMLVIFVPIALFIYLRASLGLPPLDGVAEWAAATFSGGDQAAAQSIKIAVRDFLILPGNTLNVFVAVSFASAPGAFRIVRSLALDTKSRDYVAAAETRGENIWYIMIFEILPNVRGPLIVDAALRIGYTAILLGTLGFLGIGLGTESPDWGSMISNGRNIMRSFPHEVVPPALAIMSLVLGLNLLADTLREQSLKD